MLVSKKYNCAYTSKYERFWQKRANLVDFGINFDFDKLFENHPSVINQTIILVALPQRDRQS
jgi:hypothetical protein